MNEESERLPWHASNWRELLKVRAAGRSPHALLLHGRGGLGKERFARQLAALCLCETAGAEAACGRCRGCRLIVAGTHPDLHWLAPAEGKTTLSIEQVRDLTADLSLQPHLGAMKLAVLSPAEGMTLGAANALLKTLEEPPGAALIMLVAARPGALPATVRSRCHGLRFHPPAPADALAWLQAQVQEEEHWPALLELAGGAPLLALALARGGAAAQVAELERDLQAIVEQRADPLEVADLWLREDRALWWGWLLARVAQLIRQKTLGENSDARHSGAANALPNYGRDLKLTALLSYWDALLRARPALEAIARSSTSDADRRRIELVLYALLIPWAHRLEGPAQMETVE